MKYLTYSILAVVMNFLFVPALLADEPAKKDAPIFCEKGKELVADDFASGKLSAEWRVAKGKWEVKDGAVRGVELADEKHAAVLRHELATHNLIAEFSFRFDGGKGFSFGLNSKEGHICRAKITPTLLQVTRDKPNEKSTEKAAVLDTQILDLKPGEWHTALIEVGGKTIVATIDGKVVAFGSNDAIDVDKTVFSFPVIGEGISLKAIRVWDASAPADPAAAMKKLEAQRPRAATVFERVFEQADQAKAATDVANLETAIELYGATTGTYPPNLDALVVAPRNLDTWKGPYLRKGLPTDPWGRPYNYVCPGVHNPKSFDLWSNGNGKSPRLVGSDNWSR